MVKLLAIVHYPKDENNLQELKRRVAKFHAQYVINKIQTLQLSEEETKNLMKRMCDNMK